MPPLVERILGRRAPAQVAEVIVGRHPVKVTTDSAIKWLWAVVCLKHKPMNLARLTAYGNRVITTTISVWHHWCGLTYLTNLPIRANLILRKAGTL